MPYVNVWVDKTDLDEFSTEELVEELTRRKGGMPDQREWDRLADFIAEGRTHDALDLLARIVPADIHPHTVRYFVGVRAA